MESTRNLLLETDFPSIKRARLDILQVNLGYTCNLSCTHCHVNAGPARTEQMDLVTVEQVLDVLAQRRVGTLDLTGGAPEMNPHFRHLVTRARALGVEVIDRCNLTILEEPGFAWLTDFLAEQAVTVVASLPCYSEENVSQQRGRGVFESSIRGIKRLNSVGYGTGSLTLNLVYNPTGAFLPPPQETLEADYKRILGDEHGVVFDNLFTLANMPISRFGAVLLASGEFVDYMTLLKDNFSVNNLDTLMCKNTVSVDWQGNLYDCDFNQMLALPMRLSPVDDNVTIARSGPGHSGGAGHISELLRGDQLDVHITTGDHCYGCTAGQGSSCGGALS